VCKLEAYVEEMASADQISGSVNIQKIQVDIVKLWNVVKSQPEISKEQKNLIKALYDGVVCSLHKVPDNCLWPGVPQTCRSSPSLVKSGIIEELWSEDIHTQFQTNVFGPIALIQVLLPTFCTQCSGHILM